MPISYDEFFAAARQTPLGPFAPALSEAISTYYTNVRHGSDAAWDQLLENLPAIKARRFDLGTDTVTVGEPHELADAQAFHDQLRLLMPWRKGPFNLFGNLIDAEWRSDQKWRRLMPHITELKDRSVLDIGAGNGYYLWRMLAEGARLAVGVDPTRLFLYQFELVKHFLRPEPAFVLPLRCEDLPPFGCFDTVFSLGVLSHRKSPLTHLGELFTFLRPGGELVLETLVVDGDSRTVLVPVDRYAKMANVWFIPSPAALETWLSRTGFSNVRTVDVTTTTTDEQRATAWMTYQSLADYLDPHDPSLTAEGLPAPTRAIIIASK